MIIMIIVIRVPWTGLLQPKTTSYLGASLEPGVSLIFSSFSLVLVKVS